MFSLFLFTLKLVCSAFGCLLLLRAYMRFMCTPSNDPLYAFCYSLTEWAVRSASTFIKRRGNIDWPSIFVCYLVAVLYQFFHWLVGSGSFGIFPFILGSAVLVVYWAIELAMWIALAFCIFSWVNPSGQIYRVTSFLSVLGSLQEIYSELAQPRLIGYCVFHFGKYCLSCISSVNLTFLHSLGTKNIPFQKGRFFVGKNRTE